MLTSTTNIVEVTGSSATSYTFNLPIHKATDLVVYVSAVVVPVSGGSNPHTITVAANKQSATIVFSSAPGVVPLKFERTVEFKQETDLANNSLFDAESLETSLDNIVMQTQQAGKLTTAAFGFDPGIATSDYNNSDISNASTLNKTKTQRASKALAFDADGDITVSTDNIDAQIATVAGSASDAEDAKDDAETAQEAAELALATFQSLFHGSSTSTPSSNVSDGDLWFDTNTGVNVMKVYNSTATAWEQLTPSSSNQTNINSAVSNATNINKVATIDSNVTSVANIDSNVTTVAGIAANVTSVAGDATDIGVVAGKATEIGLLGTSAMATASTGHLALLGTSAMAHASTGDIKLVADIAGNVTKVADIDSDVTAVANIDSNVTAVAGDASDIGTVATNIANVNSVGGISANVTTVAGIASNVTAVAGDATDIGVVAGKATEIGLLGTSAMAHASTGNLTLLGTSAMAHASTGYLKLVGDIDDKVTTVAGISANTTTVAGISANVTTVAGSIGNINLVAASIADVNRYANEYKIQGSAPGSPTEGDMWMDTTTNTFKVHNGTTFVTVTEGQTAVEVTAEATAQAISMSIALG